MALIIHHEPCLFNSNRYNNYVSNQTKEIKWPVFSKNEIDATQRVLSSGKVNYWTGNKCKVFEKDIRAVTLHPHSYHKALANHP